MKNHFLVLILILSVLSGCGDNAIIDEFHSLPSSGWEYGNVVTDSFEVSSTEHYHQVFVNLQVNTDYFRSNLYVKLTLVQPNGDTLTDVISIPITAKDGKWLGSGMGSTITYQYPVLGKREFKEKGSYRISIEQGMRIQNVPNIISVGTRVEQQEEIF